MEYRARLWVWGLAILVLSAIFAFQPHFGLMDDATNLFFILPKMKEQGIFSYAWAYAQNDISWGMFRPTNPLMIFFLYSFGAAFGSTLLFAFNAILVMGILYFHARVLEKILTINRWYILLCSFAFFYMHDLFQHPSLQEKMILLFGASLLWVSADKIISLPWKFIAVLLLTLVGVCVKASFAIYIAVAFLALWTAIRGQKLSNAIIFLSAIAIVDATAIFFLGWVSKQGAYITNSYSVAKIIPNLLSLEGMMFLGPVVLFFILFFRIENLKKRTEIFIPAIGVLAFLTIFLPWGIKAYIQSVITPLYAALLFQLGEALLPQRKNLWISALGVLALLVVGYRSFTMFARLHDLGKIIEMAPALYEKNVREIYMPCSEGSLAARHYFTYEKHVDLKVTELKNLENLNSKTILFDSALCALPDRISAVPGCDGQVLYNGLFKKSFHLVTQNCAIRK